MYSLISINGSKILFCNRLAARNGLAEGVYGVRLALAILLFLSPAAVVRGQGVDDVPVLGDAIGRVKSHIYADPLSVSGSLGSSLTASWNNADLHNTAPFSLTAYGNFNINIYGFSIPININFLDVSATKFTFPRPTFTINTTPTWKKWTLHLGTSRMNFSNYTYNGVSFTGAGLEYRGNIVKAAAFYGRFNKSTTFRTELDNRSAIQYLADSLLGLNNVAYTTQPQFTRRAWGAMLNVGKGRSNIGFSVMRAADDTTSLPDEWYNYELAAGEMGDTTLVARDSVVRGKENFCVGMQANLAIGSWLLFNANLGASIFTPDVSENELDYSSAVNDNQALTRAKQIIDKTGLFSLRTGTQVRLAGDAMLHLQIKTVSATVTYRFVQPDYISLGANGFNQNAQTLGGNFALPMFKNKSNFSLTGYLQRDNLDTRQIFTNQVATYSAMWNGVVGDNLSLSLSYNGVRQNQFDGTIHVNDTTRVNQITHTLMFSPSYSIRGTYDHSINLNANFLQNRNLNELMPGTAFDVTTISGGAGYDILFTEKHFSVNVGYDYSQSRSAANNYNSHAINAGSNYNIIDNEDMRLTGNASLSVAYNHHLAATTTMSKAERTAAAYRAAFIKTAATDYNTNDVSLAARIGGSFSYKTHSASLFFSISNYSDNIIIGQHIATSTDIRLSVSYNYSFASRIIKARERAKKAKAAETEPDLH